MNQFITLDVFVSKECKLLLVNFVNCFFVSLHITCFRTAAVIFMRFYTGKNIQKVVASRQFLLNSDKSNGHFTWKPTYISVSITWIITAKNVVNKPCKDKHDALTFYLVKRALCQIAQTLCSARFYVIIRVLSDCYAVSSHRRSLTIAELIFPSFVSLAYVSIVKWKLAPNNRQKAPELLCSSYSFYNYKDVNVLRTDLETTAEPQIRSVSVQNRSVK